MKKIKSLINLISINTGYWKETEIIIIDMMIEYKNSPSRGIRLIKVDDCFQLCTKPEYYKTIVEATGKTSGVSLTPVQMETLTIIAYKQPVIKAEIDRIRGVDSYNTLSKLIDYGLIEEKGRLEKRGKPVLYGTTQKYLRKFGMKSLDDLPGLDMEKRIEIEEEAEEELKNLIK